MQSRSKRIFLRRSKGKRFSLSSSPVHLPDTRHPPDFFLLAFFSRSSRFRSPLQTRTEKGFPYHNVEWSRKCWKQFSLPIIPLILVLRLQISNKKVHYKHIQRLRLDEKKEKKKKRRKIPRKRRGKSGRKKNLPSLFLACARGKMKRSECISEIDFDKWTVFFGIITSSSSSRLSAEGSAHGWSSLSTFQQL